MDLRRGIRGHELHGRKLLARVIAGSLLLAAATTPGIADDAPSRASAASPDQIHRQIDAVERDPDIQKERPRSEAKHEPVVKFRIHFPPWLPYAILGTAGLGLLFMIGRLLLRYRRPRANAVAEPLRATAGRALPLKSKEHDPTFDEIDALAASGAFAEAIHRLLLLVQARLRPRLESGMQPSLTSREILRRATLPTEAKTALSRLVGAVELTLFGLQAANAAIYADCREDCRQVLVAAA